MSNDLTTTEPRAITSPQPQSRSRALAPQSQPLSLVMRYPTMEESLRGFDHLFAQWSRGRVITFDQAIVEAATAKAAKQEADRQEAQLKAQIKTEQREREAEWQAWKDTWQRQDDAWDRYEACMASEAWDREYLPTWRVVNDPQGRPLLESGQVAYRKAMHDAAIERRLLELGRDGKLITARAGDTRVPLGAGGVEGGSLEGWRKVLRGEWAA